MRSREPVGASLPSSPPQQALSTLKNEPSTLRVLLRMPNVAVESAVASSPRFRIVKRLFSTDRLFSTLRRKYAALSLVVFVICLGALLLRGKRTSHPQDEAGEAPRWNAAIAPAPSAKPAVQV
ncbi:MAG TPA: hypothetical protein VKB78_01510, partial [Pirellulales bacterium]|nr:hypothetical protein [Pirellulales bacterium]